MPKVTAWQCPHTGKLFSEDNEKEYKRHVRKVEKEINARQVKANNRKECNEDLINARNTIDSIDKLESWILNNWRRVAETHYAEFFCKHTEFTVTSVKLNTRYSNCASNSHSAPVGQPQNWSCVSTLPKGYPAFIGQINISYTGQSNFSITSVLGYMGLHTGCGGGGSYSVTVWMQDWPALAIAHERDCIVDKLTGQ